MNILLDNLSNFTVLYFMQWITFVNGALCDNMLMLQLFMWLLNRKNKLNCL